MEKTSTEGRKPKYPTLEEKPEAEGAKILLLLGKPLSNEVFLPGHPSMGHLSLARGQAPF